MRHPVFSFIVLIIFLSACRKDERITTDADAKLTLSKNSVLFDTVFTSIGSTVQKVKLLNKNGNALNISQIKLSGASSSPFSININGQQVYSKDNLILNGNDSLTIFVKVTINPDAKSSTFLVQDSIIITSNGNKQFIPLLAYGRNAIFLNNSKINANTVWTKSLPYIINGSLDITNGSTLSIQPGTRIYFHKDAAMNVEGILTANGTFNEPIEFCSDRLETQYDNEPGQWKGIYIKQSGIGIIKNSIIKNASVAITSDSLSPNVNPKLILANTIIKNMQVAGYMGYHSELMAFNNLFYNCGNYLVYAIGGGNYNFKQNTFAGYNPDFPRKAAALTFSDYLNTKVYNKLKLDLTNNIIWGSLANELAIQDKSTASSQYNLNGNLIKTTSTNYNIGNIINTDPLFASASRGDFTLGNSSPVIKKGLDLSNDPYFNIYLNKDLKNNQRFFPSSLGCYEY